jgi:predicted ATPase/DNA-binding SARP family transcriptional activator
MRIGLLGELEVHDEEGRDVPIPGAKLRALLAVLALHAGRGVPTDQLVDALWGDDPPPAVRNGLQGLTSKLRRALGSPGAVTMRGGAYALELAPDAVDVHRYERLVAEARAAAADGDTAQALERWSEAEQLWRGEPLADFTYDDFAALPIGRLAELRLSAVEERLELQLRSGRHLAVVAELEVLVRSHPLREGPRALLMLALYRSGRQAEALQVFQDGRRQLADELGLDPGPELRQLESAILNQDPALDAPDVPAVVAAAAPPASRRTIPEPLTALVGRDAELQDLARCLAEHRLVTLVGPGGVGKTRLALEAAREASQTLEDGGVLVELAAVGDPAGVPAAISAALGLTNPNRVAELIGGRELLVVLDNCEHVIVAAAAVVNDLLTRCPKLRLVVTSREGLRVPGEIIWPVPPLQPQDAVLLFEARVRAAGAGARVDATDETRAVVADICERLDGLPLAIELAAARTRAFPVQQLASRLHDRFRLLTGGARTALPRQQTLRAVVDWSYELLFEDEQRVFERLSVFPGGCDLATAEVVCGGVDLPSEDVADLIQALVDKSLVTAASDGGGVRFTQLQTLVQYANEKLAERGDAASVRDAMAKHFAGLCARSATAYIGDEQRSWLRTVDAERDNLRAALEWAIANDDADRALTIAGGASWSHWLAGMSVEGKRWLDDAFACAEAGGTAATPTARALALTGRGLLDFQAGARTDVDGDLEEALALFEGEGDAAGMALASSFYAEVAATRREVDEARRRRRQHLDLCARQPAGPFTSAVVAYTEAKLAVLDGDLEAAERHYRAATAQFATIDRPMMLSMCQAIVADFDERVEDFASAAEGIEAAIDMNASLGLRGFNSSLLARLGWVLLQLDDPGTARPRYEEALDAARWLGNRPVLLVSLAGIALLHRIEGRREEAAAAATEALEMHLEGMALRFENRVEPSAHLHPAVVSACAVLAGSAADAGDDARAARLLGHAQRHRTENPATLPPPLVRLLAATEAIARTALGDGAFEAALAAGRTGDLASDLARQA